MVQNLTKISRQVSNRVITIATANTIFLDTRVSELLNIIDSYGGTNPFPRFVVKEANANFHYFYSCTTKIPNDSVKDFDNEILQWRKANWPV